jgi:hypothetical protein
VVVAAVVAEEAREDVKREERTGRHEKDARR